MPKPAHKVVKGTLFGGFHMSQLVARHMVGRGGGGKIVFVSSVHARIPFARSVAYNAAKIGLTHMARTIAAELLPHRINVNVIEPGWIDTPGEHATFGSEMLAAAGPTLPWGRLGTPEDIGRAAAFLCSDDADYITGTELVVDGGLCLRGAGGVSRLKGTGSISIRWPTRGGSKGTYRPSSYRTHRRDSSSSSFANANRTFFGRPSGVDSSTSMRTSDSSTR